MNKKTIYEIVENLVSILYFFGSMILTIIVALVLSWAFVDISSIFQPESNILSKPHYADRKLFEIVLSNDLEISIIGISLITKPIYFQNNYDQFSFPKIGPDDTDYDEQDLTILSKNFMGEISGEPIDSWKIMNVEYHLYDCELGFSGYVLSNYAYELPELSGEYYYVEGHKLELLPGSEFASDFPYSYAMREVEENYYPVFDESMPVTATQAYEIIEENGGYDARSQQENRYCEAVIAIDINNNEKWYIWYTGKQGVMFEGLVDRQTGKFKRVSVD